MYHPNVQDEGNTNYLGTPVETVYTTLTFPVYSEEPTYQLIVTL